VALLGSFHRGHDRRVIDSRLIERAARRLVEFLTPAGIVRSIQ